MQTKFTTSTNIIRDVNRSINYIPTPNSKRVVGQIISDFNRGIRAFNIIGSYGTGKSSFLWALQQSLLNKKRLFNISALSANKTKVINFVGEFKSITESFADYFDVKTNKHQTENIFSELFNEYHELGRKNPLLVIFID